MVSNKLKRCLSLVMAFVLSFSLLPLGAMAEEAGATQSADGTESPAAAAETTPETTTPAVEPKTVPTEGTINNTVLESIQTKMDGILEYYLGSADLTAEEAAALVAGLNPYDTVAAEMEIYELEYSDEFQQLTDKEKQALVDANAAFCAFADEVSRKASTERAISTYTTVKVLDNQVSITDTANSNTVSNGTVTIQAKGGYLSQTTNTITITNKSGSKATLSFDYSASNYSSFSETSAGGTKSAILEADGTITMSIKGKKAVSSNTATLKLSNFSLVPVKEASNVTFNFDANYGKVTVDGNEITSGSVAEVALDSGVALVATTINGATFYGWVNTETGAIMSTEASYTLTTGNDMEVEAIFAGTGTSYFAIGATTQKTESVGLLNLSKLYYFTVSYTNVYNGLNEAAAAAAAHSSSKVVIPLQNVTLAAGDYTIPAGVTLLIPFDTANTMYTTQAQSDGTHVTPTAFRTLTLADGANLIVNGSMSLSAKTRYAQGSKTDGGSPSGPVGFVNMLGSSTITVNSGANLYAYGFITGSGSVTAKSGATVYECFQIMDCRGGTQMTAMENEVFPLSQYYVQNIEVPLTLEAGATEYAFTTVFMNSYKFPAAACFIGPTEGMFRMNTGSVRKYYDGSTDRLYIEISGDGKLANIKLDVGATTVNSAKYDLAINSNITVTIKSGSTATIQQDLALLPGAEVIIENTATCTLDTGYNLFVYDQESWGNYCFSDGNKPLAPLNYAPSKQYSRTTSDLVDAKVCVDGTVYLNGAAYTTTDGANIYSNGTGVITTTPGTATVTYQLVQGTGYDEISIVPVKLKNADGSYVETADGGTNTYTYSNGRWECETHIWGDDTTCDICGLIKICGTSVKAGDCLDIFFYVNPTDFPDYASGAYTAKITRTKLTKDTASNAYTVKGTDSEDISSSDWILHEDSGYLRFCYDGIAAKEMTDTVTVTIVKTSDNTSLSQTITESIEGYALRALEKITDNGYLYTALVDMLNYGASAQSYFGYRADDLANAELTEAQQKLATSSVSYENKTTGLDTTDEHPLAGATVTAGNYVHMTFYFSNITTPSDFSAEISYTDHYGTQKGPYTIPGSEFDSLSSYYGPTVTGLAIADGRQTITCVLKKGTTTIDTVTSSVESYIASKIEEEKQNANGNEVLIELCENLMKFTDSAYAYFHHDT